MAVAHCGSVTVRVLAVVMSCLHFELSCNDHMQVSHIHASVTKQYDFVSAKRQ